MKEDICENKHGGDAESQEAFERGDKNRDREAVFALVESCGENGITLDEACDRLKKEPNQISGRFSELKLQKRIGTNGERRTTRTGSPAKVYVAVRFLTDDQLAACRFSSKFFIVVYEVDGQRKRGVRDTLKEAKLVKDFKEIYEVRGHRVIVAASNQAAGH